MSRKNSYPLGRLIILQILGLACLSLSSCLDPQAEVAVTTPEMGSSVTALSSIAGTCTGGKYEVTQVKVQLVRYSDGKAWDGSAWGGNGTVSLSTTINTSAKTWVCSAALPSGANLQADYYNISAMATLDNGSQVREESVFSVGVTAPPVTPTVYGWGDNHRGQLGVGGSTTAPVPLPVQMRGVLEGKVVVALAAGPMHSMALTSEGRVYAWGFGSLGDGLESVNVLPVAVSTTAPSALVNKKVIGIAAGDTHSLAVDDAGQVYAWGGNVFGPLGQGSGYPSSGSTVPLVVGGALAGKVVAAVAASSSFSLALTREGEVYAWGSNSFGQLGNGSTDDSIPVPTLVTGLAGKRVIAITAAHSSHSLALTDDGEVYAWGLNTDGQLGNAGTVASNIPVRVGGALMGKFVTKVATGGRHSMALTSDGKVYVWGDSAYGQLGLGGNDPVIDGSGGLVSSDPDVLVPTELGGALTGKTAVTVHAGGNFSMVTTQDGKVFAFGFDDDSQLLHPGSGSRVPVESDLSAALSGGRMLLSLNLAETNGLVLTGLKPLPGPELIVEPNINDVLTRVSSGTAVNLGTDAVGGTKSLYISLRNNGDADLTNLSVSVDGTDQADFFAGFAQARLAPGATTGFFVYFLPQKVKANMVAALHIRSSDVKNSPFDIVLNASSYRGGVLDPAFAAPALTTSVRTTAVQLDGKILVGGEFADIGGAAHNRIARLAVDGTVDAGFNASANDVVNCILVQPDGKIVIGGPFNLVNGTARNRIARLNADGTLDPDFNPDGGSGEILGMALQTDGKIVIAGSFSDIGSSGRSRLARLNGDGTVDTGFNPTVNGTVNSVAVVADGRVVIGGSFTTVGGASHQRMARLAANGTVDATFNPHITDGVVNCVAVQPSGRVIVAGSFTNLAIGANNYTRNNIARVTTAGALDTPARTFNPNANGAITAMTLQADEGILIGGSFTTVGGYSRSGLARLFGYDGATDYGFTTGVDGPLNSIGLQKDGRMLLAGGFGAVGGASSPRLARILNNSVFEAIVVPTLDTIFWNRGGGAPEIQQATFDVSTDGGTSWSPLGTASRNVSGTLTMVGLTLPTPGMIRARGFPVGGYNGGSSGMIETIASYGGPPEISVVSSGGMAQASGSTRDFGVVATGTGISTVTFTVQNAGPGLLTAVNSAFISGPAAASFRITGTPSASVVAGGSTDIVITFSPRNQGFIPVSPPTFLRIPNNDQDESQYDILLTGTGGIDTANWKIQNQQAGVADTADTDGDGLSTLMENALGASPTNFSGAGVSISVPSGGGGGEGGAPPPPPAVFTFNYTRNKLALGDLVFQVEWSDSLQASDWHTTGVTEQVMSEAGAQQQVQATIPAGSGRARFARLKVTRP